MSHIHRVGSTCERCRNISSEELEVTHYTENDDDRLLCDNCIKEIRKERDEEIENVKKIHAIQKETQGKEKRNKRNNRITLNFKQFGITAGVVITIITGIILIYQFIQTFD